MKEYNKLTKEEEHIILDKGTEAPFSGEYTNYYETGIYLCKRCNAPLYKSEYKFHSHCGWPSFDDEIPNAVKKQPDSDGKRTEIVCNNCNGHLGHIFSGEQYTKKNIRHCVNSLSLKFIKTEQAIYAGGCFWGVEYHYKKLNGVIYTEVGYSGGQLVNPTYEAVCNGDTGHAEALRIYFDKDKISYEELTKLFFEIHDPTQINRQGPDIGKQYRSVIFYTNEEQKQISEALIKRLEEKGYKVATKLEKATNFWRAEEYHQDYYNKKGDEPYCHIYKKRF